MKRVLFLSEFTISFFDPGEIEQRLGRPKTRHVLALMFVAAFLFRLPLLVLKHPGFPPLWGGEMHSVAVSIATGHGFASPYWVESGPTALVPPVYVYVLALIYTIFGAHTELSGNVALFTSACFSAATVIPVYLIGRRLFGLLAGLVAGVMWVLYPLTGYSEFLYNWNTSLFAFLLTLVFFVTLSMTRDTPPLLWLGFGVLIGLAILTDLPLLLLFPLIVLWLYWRKRIPISYLVWALVGVVLILAPWLIRNAIVFDQFIVIRSGLGLELNRAIYIDDFVSTEHEFLIPVRDADETARYLEMGEIAYMDEQLTLALDKIIGEPESYGVRTLRRIIAFWAGSAHVANIYWFIGRLRAIKHLIFLLPALLALSGLYVMFRRRINGRFLLLFVFAFYPLSYYFSLTYPRYRAPIEPLMFVLAAFVLVQLMRWSFKQVGLPAKSDVADRAA